jgi:PD-(D/E)XK nuclease superfamily
MTEFRRRLRYHQARWRIANGHPIGSQPIVPRPDGGPARVVGSHIPLAYARDTGANFISRGALDAARARASLTEPHQSFDHQGLWADLLSSAAMSFNLFGDLAADLKLADRAVHTWWPDVPGTVQDIRFAHSPGRFDRAYMNSLRAFDVAIVLSLPDGAQGIIAIDIRYHERAKPEIPKPSNLARYLQVAKRSGIFARGALDAVKGRSPFALMWLEHLLMLSMLQHVSGAWGWGRYVVVYPAGNSDFADLTARYTEFLAERSTFSTATTERLLDSNVLPRRTAAALRARYLPQEQPLT